MKKSISLTLMAFTITVLLIDRISPAEAQNQFCATRSQISSLEAQLSGIATAMNMINTSVGANQASLRSVDRKLTRIEESL